MKSCLSSHCLRRGLRVRIALVRGDSGACGRSSDEQRCRATRGLPWSIDYYQPFFVKLGFTYALNTTSSQLWAQNPIALSAGNFAAFPLGVGTTIGNVATVGVELGVFVTRNISIDVSARRSGLWSTTRPKAITFKTRS